MEKIAKILIGAYIIIILVVVLFQGKITGKATNVCSEPPEITYIEGIKDTISLNWKDTSLESGQQRYKLYLFKEEDLENPLRIEYSEQPNFAFNVLEKGKYLVQVAAKNKGGCAKAYEIAADEVEVPESYATTAG